MNGAATLASAGAQSISVATGIASKAQLLWNAALIANPIGLIVAAIAAVVAGLPFRASTTAKLALHGSPGAPSDDVFGTDRAIIDRLPGAGRRVHPAFTLSEAEVRHGARSEQARAVDDLLARREATEKSSSCPHGRPTTLRLTLKDLEKQFRRT